MFLLLPIYNCAVVEGMSHDQVFLNWECQLLLFKNFFQLKNSSYQLSDVWKLEFQQFQWWISFFSMYEVLRMWKLRNWNIYFSSKMCRKFSFTPLALQMFCWVCILFIPDVFAHPSRCPTLLLSIQLRHRTDGLTLAQQVKRAKIYLLLLEYSAPNWLIHGLIFLCMLSTGSCTPLTPPVVSV